MRVGCGGGRDDCEVAGNHTPKGMMNGRELSGLDGEQRGLGVDDSRNGGTVVVVKITSLQLLLEWDGKDGSHESEESDGSDSLHVEFFFPLILGCCVCVWVVRCVKKGKANAFYEQRGCKEEEE